MRKRIEEVKRELVFDSKPNRNSSAVGWVPTEVRWSFVYAWLVTVVCCTALLIDWVRLAESLIDIASTHFLLIYLLAKARPFDSN